MASGLAIRRLGHLVHKTMKEPVSLPGSTFCISGIYLSFQREKLMLTRVFKSGNSLAVRIPKELGFVDAAQDVEVERVGNTLVLRLVAQETLADIGEIFAMFSPSFMADGREFHQERERDWRASGTDLHAHAAKG